MSAVDNKKEEIVNFFKSSVKEYNNIIKSDYESKPDVLKNFNSNLQFYSAIECAFRCLIDDLGHVCPKKFHEMVKILIENLSPNPLEIGIDMFYILRYKDTRNDFTHELNLQEINVYPKLFYNGYKFLKEYIDPNIEVENWELCTIDFDYYDFSQNFKTSLYDNIRVLVIPPIYNKWEMMKSLESIHWNIILDFDPYSEKYGAFSKIRLKNTSLIHLSEVERYGAGSYSVENTTWVMCDGDALMGIDSFKPRGGTSCHDYIPAMLDGKNNWSRCFNSNSTLTAKQLIKKFFESYLGVINYDVNMVFVMDYSQPVYLSIIDAVDDTINHSSNSYRVDIINESLSKELHKEALNYDWNIYDSSFESFLKKIENNKVFTPDECNYQLPFDNTCDVDGKISERMYNRISKDFYLLHSLFPGDYDNELEMVHSIDDSLKRFLRGEIVEWSLIESGILPELEMEKSVKNKIENALEHGRKSINLYHVAGFGGSTLARKLAFRFKDEYPVLFMKHYDKDSLDNKISSIYNLTRKRIIVFVDESIYDNVVVQKRECLKLSESTSVPVMFVFVARMPQSYKKSNEEIFIKRWIASDVDKIIKLNKKFLEKTNEKREILKNSKEIFFEELGEENICPFLINLSIYKDEFVKIDQYIEPFAKEIIKNKELKDLISYSCIFTSFINKGLPLKLIISKLGIVDQQWPAIRDKYDPIIFVRHNIEYHINEVVIRAPYMAECLLRRLIGEGNEGLLYKENLNHLLKNLIREFSNFYKDQKYSERTFRKLFIDKVHYETENEYTEMIVDNDLTMIKKYFSPIISKLWEKDNINLAGEIFESLIKYFPDNSYFYAHAARFYSYTGRDYEKSRLYCDNAIKYLCEFDNKYDYRPSSKADIYHVKGMCVREELFKNYTRMDKTNISDETKLKLKKLYFESSEAFEKSLDIASEVDIVTYEYAYTAHLTLIVKTILNHKDLLSKDEIEKELQKAFEIISNLEDLYLVLDTTDKEAKKNKLEDIERKRNSLQAVRLDKKEAISHWNNYYDSSKNKGEYMNCIYSCKQRYYLLEQITEYFKETDKKDEKRIKKLSDDFYQSLLNLDYTEITDGDLKTFISISTIASTKLENVMPIISGLHALKKNRQILYYRYVIKFLQAYNGDVLALRECNNYSKECKDFSERFSGKSNIIDYFIEGENMGQLLSRRRLVKLNPMYETQAYKSNHLKYIKGILKHYGNETSIIPIDKQGNIMNGIEIHANLKHNPNVEITDNGQKVMFRFGFSYDGMKAENMSIKFPDDIE